MELGEVGHVGADIEALGSAAIDGHTQRPPAVDLTLPVCHCAGVGGLIGEKERSEIVEQAVAVHVHGHRDLGHRIAVRNL